MFIQTERMSLLTTENTLGGSHREADAETHIAASWSPVNHAKKFRLKLGCIVRDPVP